MDVVAILALARSVDDEAPRLAVDLGLTVYEVGIMLRAPMPVVVMRTDDHSRAVDLLGKLRTRGHDATIVEWDSVVTSEQMFRPKFFRFEGTDLIGIASGEERRLALVDVYALLRATHATVVVDTQTATNRSMSIGRAVMTGGLLMTKATTTESKKISTERQGVLYIYRADAPPWLLVGNELRYEGLGTQMQPAQHANFEVLIRLLREYAPTAVFDARLLNVRPSPTTLINTTSKHLATSSSGAIDLFAHIVAWSHSRASRPYR